MATILITGCSSGFGLETARLFVERGWNVVAAMRKPDARVLPASDKLRIVQLDVTDAASVARAVGEAGPIDVLVNNAGFGVPAPIELIDPTVARSLFETNTLGRSRWCRPCCRRSANAARVWSSTSARRPR